MGAKVKKPTRKAKPGIIDVDGIGKIPIAKGHLIRVNVLESGTALHVTSYDGKNVNVFIGGPVELIGVETPK